MERVVRLEVGGRELLCLIAVGRVEWELDDIGMFAVIEKGRRRWRWLVWTYGRLTILVPCRKIVRDSIHGISKLLFCGNGWA